MYRNLILVSLSLGFWGLGESAFIYFQPLYLEELGASPVIIGSILGAVGFVMTIVHIPAGYLSDRIGSRSIIWAAWGLGLLSALLMVLANTLPVFTAGMILYGSTAFIISPLNSYLTEARGNLSIWRVFTLTTAIYNFGAIIGPIIGGKIGAMFNLHAIYLFSLAAFTCSFLIVLNIQPQKKPSSHPRSSRQVFKNRKYLGFLVLVFFVTFTMYLPYPLTTVYLKNVKNIPVQTIGFLGSLGSLGNVVISLGLGALQPYVGVVLGQSAVTLSSFLFWKGNGTFFLGLGFFLYGGFRATGGLTAALSNKYVDDTNMGLAYGFTAAVTTISVILAPPLAGFLYEISPSRIYITSIILGFASMLVWSIFWLKGKNAKQSGD